MNVTQYLAEMRALGHRFYVIQHPSKKERGILQLLPDQPGNDRWNELEAWRRANTNNKELAKAILADELKPSTQSKEKSHV